MGTEARARLGLAGLLLATLFAFGQVFANDNYVGPCLLAMLAATGLAVLCRRLGVAPWLTLWASVAALGWYVVVIFQAANTAYGLPTPAAAAGVTRAVRVALDASRVDFAPVPVRPGYVIMTVVGMWLCAALGEVATFRWRRPLLASLGPVALFALLVIVGTGVGSGLLVVLFLAALLTYWGLESAHRLRSWGRWVGAWRTPGDEESVTGRVARRMGLSAIAAALIAPMVVPALGDGLLSWRTSTGDGPGIGPGGRSISPIVDLQPQLVDQTAEELFRVRSEEATYWRLASLSEFDGRIWRQGDAPTATVVGGVVGAAEPLPQVDRELVQAYSLTNLGGPYFPAVDRPTTVSGLDDGSAVVDAETLQLEATDHDVGGEDYRVLSLVPDLSYPEMLDAEIGNLGPEWRESYTRLPASVSPRITELANQWTAGAESPFEKLVAIQDRFQSGEYRYNLNVAQPTTNDYLEEFLFTTKTGYCQQYATAFGVLARALGYPTRVSVGFLPGSPDPEEPDVYVVRGRETHAWPEVHFADYGWVRFEPTPRDISPELPYTVDPTAGPTAANPAQADLALSGQAGRTAREGPQGGQPDCGQLAGRLQEQCSNPGGAGAEALGGGQRQRQAQRSYAWEKTFATLSRVLLLLALIFLLAVPAAKEMRARRRYARAKTPSARTAAAFAQFVDDASELALGRAPSESAIAYVSRLGRAEQIDGRRAERLARLYELAEYSQGGATAGQGAEAQRLAARLRKSMWRRATWVRRIRRLFSPTGLRPQLSWKPARALRARLAHRS